VGSIRAGVVVDDVAYARVAVATKTARRRHISPQSGRALEILGHAIEYLTDEYIRSANQISARDPDVQAIQMLMALNREIYYECPLKPTLIERLQVWFHGVRSAI
jgi:hypothetical protein